MTGCLSSPTAEYVHLVALGVVPELRALKPTRFKIPESGETRPKASRTKELSSFPFPKSRASQLQPVGRPIAGVEVKDHLKGHRGVQKFGQERKNSSIHTGPQSTIALKGLFDTGSRAAQYCFSRVSKDLHRGLIVRKPQNPILIFKTLNPKP